MSAKGKQQKQPKVLDMFLSQHDRKKEEQEDGAQKKSKKHKRSSPAAAAAHGEEGTIFSVRYNKASCCEDAIVKDENTEAAKSIVRRCDALFEGFLQDVRDVVLQNKHLFAEGARARLLLAEDGAEKICSELSMCITE